MSPHKIHTLPSPNSLSQYAIHRAGFLPPEPPLLRLPHPTYRPWENLINNIVLLLVDGDAFRRLIDRQPVLDTCDLESDAEWRRAYSILAMLAQAYIWGGEVPAQRLPPPIAVPFLEVAEYLDVHPVATYAALNLWNFQVNPVDPDMTNPDNLTALHTLTGTEDESWFYMVSNAMEARAAPLLNTMLSAMETIEADANSAIITSSLEYLSTSLQEIGILLERMDEHCDPDIFYHQIRPMLAGSRNMEDAGLPNGVLFDEGDGTGSYRRFRGGSNGQSSLIQFFDIVLGINHEKSQFHQEMRQYMPGSHARFLDDLEQVANIRAFVEDHPKDTALRTAYNAAVSSLSTFRDKHIQLVTRYIILPSRRAIKPTTANNLATLCTKAGNMKIGSSDLVGTGGTKLVPFLKGSRDETVAAIVPDSPR